MKSRSQARGFSVPSVTLLLRSPSGDRRLDEFRPRLQAFFGARGLGVEDAEDLAQETTVRLLRWPPGSDVFEQAAYRAAECVFADYWRRKKPPCVSFGLGDEGQIEEDPSGRLALSLDIRNAIMAMPPFQKEVLLLAMEGYNETETAAILDTSSDRVSRTLRRLRAKLARAGLRTVR
jgi:RNA polymerase sigma factor (sigma-70 family)